MTVKEPNFFLVGAAKSGTTALYHALSQHPDVFLTAVKEPHFYAYLADPSTGGHLFADQASARSYYRDLYAGAAGQRAVGDASTTNLVVTGAAAAIARDAPSAKIVAILRQPVDRAFSHYCHFLAAGGEESLSFARAIREEKARQARGYPFTYQYLGWGRYAEQLPPFYDLFGRDRVLVLLYDELCDDPRSVVRRTCEFLGVDASCASPIERHNQIPVPRFPGAIRALKCEGRAGWVVRRAVPTRFRRPIADWVSQRVTSRPALDADLRAELTAALADDISRLEDLIACDLSRWR